jgi:hypothetical protein
MAAALTVKTDLRDADVGSVRREGAIRPAHADRRGGANA